MNNYVKPTGKAKQILEAVMQLYNKGTDFYVMKISDIALEAGIGKGTVYEYFSTKDEIIKEAVVYAMKQDIDMICDKINSNDTFDGMFDTAVEAIEENINKSCPLAFLIIRSMMEDSKELIHEFINEFLNLEDYQDVIEHFVEVGQREGAIRGPQNDLELMMAFNVFMCYAQYMIRCRNFPEEPHASKDETREYCKKMLKRVLSD